METVCFPSGFAPPPARQPTATGDRSHFPFSGAFSSASRQGPTRDERPPPGHSAAGYVRQPGAPAGGQWLQTAAPPHTRDTRDNQRRVRVCRAREKGDRLLVFEGRPPALAGVSPRRPPDDLSHRRAPQTPATMKLLSHASTALALVALVHALPDDEAAPGSSTRPPRPRARLLTRDAEQNPRRPRPGPSRSWRSARTPASRPPPSSPPPSTPSARRRSAAPPFRPSPTSHSRRSRSRRPRPTPRPPSRRTRTQRLPRSAPTRHPRPPAASLRPV